jgi:hypothetical protein
MTQGVRVHASSLDRVDWNADQVDQLFESLRNRVQVVGENRGTP